MSVSSIDSRVAGFGDRFFKHIHDIVDRVPATAGAIAKKEIDFVKNEVIPEVKGWINQISTQQLAELKKIIDDAAKNGATLQIKAVLPTGLGLRATFSENQSNELMLSLALVASTSTGASIAVLKTTPIASPGNFAIGKCQTTSDVYVSVGGSYNTPYAGERVAVRSDCVEGKSYISFGNAHESNASAFIQLNNVNVNKLKKSIEKLIEGRKPEDFEEELISRLNKYSGGLTAGQVENLRNWRKNNFPDGKIDKAYEIAHNKYETNSYSETITAMVNMVLAKVDPLKQIGD